MKTLNRRRLGFTLVELLVVITIIGMLMALLLPAVNAARESGRRAVCLNNIKQLALAVRAYETRNRELPGYTNTIAKPTTNTGIPRMAPWIVMILPDLERNDIYSTWSDRTVEARIPSMEVTICPSDPPETPGAPSLSYVANCGIPDLKSLWTGANPAITQEKAANGVFFNRYKNSIPPTPAGPPANWETPVEIAMSLDHVVDGTSTTLMLSENIQAEDYAAGTASDTTDWFRTPASLSSSISINTAMDHVRETEADTGFVWDPRVKNRTSPPADETSNTYLLPVNGVKEPKNLPADGTPDRYRYARPSSRHSGGVNVAMCGGEAFFLRDSIDYWVFQQLMTSNSKLSDMFDDSDPNKSHKTYLLNDVDFK